jgi:hypothetical protein
VTVIATDATASETGSDPGVFTFTRTGSTSGSLTVHYTFSGTATKWTDYRRWEGDMPVEITIPAGATSAALTIHPVDDTEVEETETVILTISPDAAYTVGSPGNAMVTLTDNDSPAQPGALPAPWQHRDVGAVGLAGNAAHDGTSFNVTGSGRDIWGTADGFHFVFQSWTGDGQIITRVTGVQNTDPWAKSGVMFRQSLDAGAANAFMMLTPLNGPGFQSRANPDGATTYAPGRWAAAPHWLKLTRSGNLITGSTSTDGANWTVVSSQTLSMSGSILVGLAVTSHNNSTANTSSFNNVLVNAVAATSAPPGVVASSQDAPRLDSPTPDEAGGVSLTLHGETGRTYAVMSSEDLVHWTPLFNRSNPDGTITFTDSDAANHPHRFYRAVGAL